jgi:hypothetical protein
MMNPLNVKNSVIATPPVAKAQSRPWNSLLNSSGIVKVG